MPDGTQDAGRLTAEQARELASLLTELGLDKRQARIIGYLAHHADGRSAEIERACDLRQPQVSQATTSLEERGWVRTGREKTPGKGRPVNVYSLKVGLADVVEEVTADRREAINEDLARIEKAKRLVQRPRAEPSPSKPHQEMEPADRA